MKAIIRPSVPRGIIQAPPSKSFAHRMMICAALSRKDCVVKGISGSEDMRATLDCISAMGVRAEVNDDVLTVGCGTGIKAEGAVFPCRESGSTLRFFLPIAAAMGGKSVFMGTERLIERGIGVYEDLFAACGIGIEKTTDRITIDGCLKPGDYAIPGHISSQFVTGLLFALSMLEGDSSLTVLPPVESRPYIDITRETMALFGVTVEEPEKNRFVIPGGQQYQPGSRQVEGDWSNAAVWYALQMLGGELDVTGLNHRSLQGDRVCRDYLNLIGSGCPELDLSDCPDLGPVLMAAAAAKQGALFTGTRRLAIKESNRGAAMAEELLKFGVRCEMTENSLRIPGSALQAPTDELDGHNDHRIVMAMALLCCVTGGTVKGIGAVAKSYPDFFEKLEQAGVKITYEA